MNNYTRTLFFLVLSGLFFFSGHTIANAKTMPLPNKYVHAESGCSTNDLQDLLNLNKEQNYQLTIEIPEGTYLLDQTLYIYPNTTIQASSSSHFVKQRCYGAMLEAKLQKGHTGYQGNYNITVDGGIWDAYLTMNEKTGTELFRFIHCNNITIRNLTLCNVPEGSHLLVFAGVRNASVTNCTFYGYGDDGDSSITHKEAIQLDVVHSKTQVPTTQAELITWDDLPCDQITISDCDFSDYSRGIGSHTAVAGRLHRNIKITKNHFSDLSDSAIRLYNYKNTTVTNNIMDHIAEGILVYNYMESADELSYFQPVDGATYELPSDYKIAISENRITNVKRISQTWGDGIRVIGANSRPMKGVIIRNNMIGSTDRYGIFTTVTPGIQIYNNQITDTARHGILVEESSHYSSIYENRVSKSTQSGIALYYSDSCQIYDNSISRPKAYGIYLISSAKCTIGKGLSTGNTITNTGKSSIYLTTSGKAKSGCKSSKIQYNTIGTAGENGICIQKASSVSVKNNTISAKKHGIYVYNSCSSAAITSNTIKSARQHGICVTGSCHYANIRENSILKYGTTSGRYGIFVENSGGKKGTYTKIFYNSIRTSGSGTSRDGIKVSRSSYTSIYDNKITTPAGNGVCLYYSKNCVVNKNQITSPKNRGIYLNQSCDKSQVVSNTIVKASGTALRIYRSPKSIASSNKITTKNQLRGIWVSSSGQTQLKRNTIKGTGKRNAIVISGSSGCVTIKNFIH